jgi:outer membrane biosynthesis protein TonB
MLLAACASTPAPEADVPAVASAAPATSAPVAPPPSAPSTPSEVLDRNRSAFDACYTQARAADANLGRTKVEITFAVNADGVPQTVDLKYRNRFDDKAKDCMRDAALAARFPASMQGSQTATIAFAPPGP